jgi:seryl-tRNA synthetase
MLDIKLIRQNPELVKEGCRKKQVKVDIDRLLEIDKKRKELLLALEDIRAQKNKANDEIQQLHDKEEREVVILKMRELDTNSDRIETEFKTVDSQFQDLLLRLPNLAFDDIPVGEDERGNVPIRKWGEPRKLDFEPKDHVALGEALDIIDTEKAGKITGARFNYLKNEAARLEFALVQHVFNTLTSKEIIKKIADSIEKNYAANLFIPIVPPVMIRPDVFTRMARLSEEDKEQRYYIPSDDLYLVGSAEHTLGPLHMDEIIEEKNLPIRYIGFSTAFRREAGSYGKDTKGILRVHQFDKLEMESFTTAENSVKEQDFIVAIQEYLVQSLKIPYQVVMICTGDMGKPDARQIDIECWLPGQNKYRETHTSDLMTDYQSRRLNSRVRRKDGQLKFVHMNDATAFAIGRTIIAILENYQQKDGSILIPKVLQKYTGFKEIKR